MRLFWVIFKHYEPYRIDTDALLGRCTWTQIRNLGRDNTSTASSLITTDFGAFQICCITDESGQWQGSRSTSWVDGKILTIDLEIDCSFTDLQLWFLTLFWLWWRRVFATWDSKLGNQVSCLPNSKIQFWIFVLLISLYYNLLCPCTSSL